MLIGCIWLQSISLMPCCPKATVMLQKVGYRSVVQNSVEFTSLSMCKRSCSFIPYLWLFSCGAHVRMIRHCSSLQMGHRAAAAIPSPLWEQQGEDKASGAGKESVWRRSVRGSRQQDGKRSAVVMHIRAELPWAMAIGNKMVTLSPVHRFRVVHSACFLALASACALATWVRIEQDTAE